MDWYCSLTEHLLNKDNVVIGNESFESILQRLEKTVVTLYKALLLYQMKSVCSYYQSQGLVFLRGLANLNDWDGDLKSVTDAEIALQKDSDQYNKQHAKRLLGDLVNSARKRQSLLGDIHQGLQDIIAQQKDMHKDEKDNQCLEALRASNPGDDKIRIEQTKGGLLQDSYLWILENDDFQRWRNDQQSRLLWINGDPGKGKTMLLCGIINELKKSTAEAGLLSYFFCQGTDLRINSATAVLRGLIYLLVKQQPPLISHVREKYDQGVKEPFEGVNAWVVLSEVFTNILQDPSLKSTYLIVDALDECVTDLPQLLDLIAQKSSVSSPVKWIVSSRNWPDIAERLEIAEQKVRLSLELNTDSVSAAVSKYIQYKVPRLTRRKKYNKETESAVQHHLILNANDTFLWVALVCQMLEKIERWNTLAMLNAFPPGLDSLHKQMIEQVCNSDNADLCKRILSVIAVIRRPVTLKELSSLVETLEPHSDDLESLEEIIGFCGSFLTLRERTVYFVHQSAKDYLLTKASDEIFPCGIGMVHYTIFLRSLEIMSRTLRRDMYGLHAPGFTIDKIKQPDSDPLVAAGYCCIYWVDHLCEWDFSKGGKYSGGLLDGGEVDNFLRKQYLYWLEALSLLRSISEGVISMIKLEGLLQVSLTLRKCYLTL